ncbi:hypothetical protein H9W90_01250 [Polaribacter pectinis]|uniref:Glycosyl transferase family 1 domain-containing protein n=1 Tax=Polaribacter pectinis TaxID=2738844 RepID=A0A7G9LAX6_9FLAO|nr:hypothetical protein [Polaribacter pectinis]QNM85775.1 hypothetical protein H9W90_01250 [Polaribacter pectinis]
MEKLSVKKFRYMNNFCTYPYVKNDNPFLKLMLNHLQDFGWTQKSIKFRTLHLLKFRNEVSVLWFHWPNSLWRNKIIILKYLSVLRFIYHVLLAKFLGYKLVWSVHNVMPHGEQDSTLEFFIRKFITKNFHLLIGHANNTYKALEEKKLIPQEYVLAVHGHYENEYDQKNLKITRKALNISEEKYVILIKSGGKNFDSSLKFAKTFDSIELKNIQLLVLGNKISDNVNVTFIPGFVKDEDLSSYISISDYVALPYEEITTSGAYFLAITLEKPVIAKNLPFFREHGGDKSCLIFDDSEDLKEKLIKLEEGHFCFEKSNIIEVKNKYTWKNASKQISESFNKLLLNS